MFRMAAFLDNRRFLLFSDRFPLYSLQNAALAPQLRF